MAADSACTNDERIEHDVAKIFRVNGSLVGCCGAYADIVKFKKWLKEGADPDDHPSIVDGFDALVVRPNGEVRCYDGYMVLPIKPIARYFAIGAGGDVALGALYAGASATKAIRASCAHNVMTRPPVRTYRL